MKRILFLVLIAFVSCVCSYADQYVIEDLSTTTINIGGIEKKVGDEFSDTSTIKWSSPKQFMRARNLNKQGAKSKKFYQAAFVEKQATSIADYYSKIDHLSTMGPVNAGKVTWHDGRNKTKYPDNRKAIVIGNSEYSNIDYLINPVGDAILVTEKLQDLGFDVATCYDGQIADMKRALNSFCDKSKGCDVALFYYAGHGLQDSENSINYLLPVNINMDEDYVNSRNCLSGLDVRDNIQKLRCKVNILLFDACRSDFSVRGFNSSAFTMEAGNNTVVMYSTSNGTVAYDGYRGGKNGPFASAFLDHVGTPGITLSATLKKIQIKVKDLSNGQTPSISDNVVTDFFFEPESKMSSVNPGSLEDNPQDLNSVSLAAANSIANPTTGFLSIKSDPTGASVFIDGKNIGKTPLSEYELSAGKHRLRLTKDSNYKDITAEVEIIAGRSKDVEYVLNAKPKSPKTTATGVASSPIQPTKGTHNGHEWVDLGLPSGTKWATCNIGASSPSDYGSYYAWGESSQKSSYSWKHYFDAKYGNFNNCYVYYNNGGKTKISPVSGHDTARQNWGGSWRMPTVAEFKELITCCIWTWTVQDGHAGYMVKSKKNNNSIFLPAAGWRLSTSLNYLDERGGYWSSELSLSGSFGARQLFFDYNDINTGDDARCMGMSVRPVRE